MFSQVDLIEKLMKPTKIWSKIGAWMQIVELEDIDNFNEMEFL